MKQFRILIPFIFTPFLLQAESTKIQANSENIHVSGLKYTTADPDELTLQRFRPDILQIPSSKLGVNPDKARNPSGGIISFATDSPSWTARFHVSISNYMGSGFGVFENGQLVKEFKYSPKEKDIDFNITAGKKGTSVFEIALPSYSTVEFRGLEIKKGHELKPHTPAEKPVYVALGDSISHGSGQDGYGHKTWPFLLSRKLNMELYNLAVGGGKISVPVAEMLEDWATINLVTILVGYNGLHFNGKSPEQYTNDYAALLDSIRKNHPTTKVVCISLLYTRKQVSEKTGHTVDQYRKALETLIMKRQSTDPNLVFIPGETISSEKNLRTDNPNDPVHLGIEGAAKLADELYKILR
ncbi:MAG: SGNH/GDSL hydrolase family protein [Puniceicoccaceae bacterium]